MLFTFKERKIFNRGKKFLKKQAESMDSLFVRILLGSAEDSILNASSEKEKKFNEEVRDIYKSILRKRGEPVE